MTEQDLRQRLTLLGEHLDIERAARSPALASEGQEYSGSGLRASESDRSRKVPRIRPGSVLVAAGLLVVVGLVAAVGIRSSRSDSGELTIDTVGAEGLQPDELATYREPTTGLAPGCDVSIRVYSAGAPTGSASLLTGAIFEIIRQADSAPLLMPRATSPWDGSVAFLVGADATCFDLALLNLLEPDAVVTGDLLSAWTDLGLDVDGNGPEDESSNTVLVVLGTAYDPNTTVYPPVLGPDGLPAGEAIPVDPNQQLPGDGSD